MSFEKNRVICMDMHCTLHSIARLVTMSCIFLECCTVLTHWRRSEIIIQLEASNPSNMHNPQSLYLMVSNTDFPY